MDTLRGLAIPRLADAGAGLIAVSVLGSLIMPHNLYLHSALTLMRTTGPSLDERRRIVRWGVVDLGLAIVVSVFINSSAVMVADYAAANATGDVSGRAPAGLA